MKLSVLSLIILFSLITVNSFSQQFWLQKAGSPTIDEGVGVASDAAGNTYTTGYFTSTATFGSFNLTSEGISDIYIAKLNNLGVFQWAVRAGGPGSDRPSSIRTDAAGNCYITGFYAGTANFGTFNITAVSTENVFVAKYDSTGTCLWVMSAGGSEGTIGNNLAIDGTGNVIVTGEFSGTATFGTSTFTSMNNSVDVFIMKLDNNGNFLWAKQGAAPNTDRGIDVVCDDAENIYVTGTFTDTITFDFTTNCDMYNGIFLVKYNAAGVEQWLKFSGGGDYNVPNAISIDQSGNPVITGDLHGPITFYYCPGNTTMTTTFPDNIFLAKYDSYGNLLWSLANGSNSFVTAKNIIDDASGINYVVGNFSCRFNQYADEYGQGTFNTVGYTDMFVSAFDVNGIKIYSRQIGGHGEDNGAGIALNPSNQVLLTGSFAEDIIFPVRVTNFIGYASGDYSGCTYSYCNDNNYDNYVGVVTTGNLDIFIANCLDTMRQTYDYFQRTGNTCLRPFNTLCIANYYADCSDSTAGCGRVVLIASDHACSNLEPHYTYHWSTGDTTNTTNALNSGWYYVTQTYPDSCDVQTDSIYVTIHPDPPYPTITDDDSININAFSTTPIAVCMPDTIVLTGRNFAYNDTLIWTTPMGQVHDSICVATVTGTYTFSVIDSFGCYNQNEIYLEFDSALSTVYPELFCIQDTAHNDSIQVCLGNYFTMGFLDSLTNAVVCYPHTTIYWSIAPTTASFNPITMTGDCQFWMYNNFYPTATADYTITAFLIRTNSCDTATVIVTKDIFVQVDSVPVVAVSGNLMICPGDSNLLVAMGGANYTWGYNYYNPYGFQNIAIGDSIYVQQQGYYCITAFSAAGCWDTTIVFVQIKPTPELTTNPTNGIICPFDSILLMVTGSGTFLWEGPDGIIPVNANQIYVSQAGQYYCYVTDSDGCSQLSNTVIITQFNTPYLRVIPDSIFCAGDSVELLVVTTPGSDLNWLAPLSGDSLFMFVDTTGTYSCSVFACNITTIVSAHVTMISAFAQISYTGPTTFCSGDSLVLSANAAMTHYLWLPDSLTSQSITVYQSGIYSLTTMDSLGCQGHDTITITVTPPYYTPYLTVTPDTLFCQGDSVTINLFTDSLSTIQWLSPLTGNGYHQVVDTTGTYMVNVSYCNITTIDSITVVEVIPVAQINYTGPTTFCSGDSIVLTAYSPNAQCVWHPGNSITQSITVFQSGSYSIVTTDSIGCQAFDTVAITVTPAYFTPYLLASPDTFFCIGNTVMINLIADSLSTVQWLNPLSGNGFQQVVDITGTYYCSVTYCNITTTDSITVSELNPIATITVSGPLIFCSGDSVTLTGNANFTSYAWHPDSSSMQSITVYYPGTYWLTITNFIGCTATDSVVVDTIPNAAPTVPDTTICSGTSITLTATGNQQIYWYYTLLATMPFDSGYTDTTPILYAQVTYYIQSVNAQCTSVMDSVVISVQNCQCEAPNVFSPNNDGYNDEFQLKAPGYKNYHLIIFNRYGEKLFESIQSELLWDGYDMSGMQVPEGTYYYIFTANDPNNNPYSYKGFVTLVR